LKKKDL